MHAFRSGLSAPCFFPKYALVTNATPSVPTTPRASRVPKHGAQMPAATRAPGQASIMNCESARAASTCAVRLSWMEFL